MLLTRIFLLIPSSYDHLFEFGRETFHLISGGKVPPDVPQSRGDPIVLQFQHTESTSTLPHCNTLANIPFVLEQFFGQYSYTIEIIKSMLPQRYHGWINQCKDHKVGHCSPSTVLFGIDGIMIKFVPI